MPTWYVHTKVIARACVKLKVAKYEVGGANVQSNSGFVHLLGF
jgi:hypothetical protein